MEAELDELRMDLLKGFYTFAFGKQGKGRMDLEEFVRWVGGEREEV